jgi:hypothetical protein
MLTLNLLNLLQDLKSRLYLRLRKRRREDPSQLSEAGIIRLLIENLSKNGVTVPSTFLDIGANHPFYLSTSWYLEHTLGFNGVSVDPIANFQSLYQKLRPNSKFISCIVVNNSSNSSELEFFEAQADVFSTADIHEFQKLNKKGITFSRKLVQTVKYDRLAGILNYSVGVLILDIESTRQQIQILEDIISNEQCLPFIICVETLEYQGATDWEDRRLLYDAILCSHYTIAASTFLNTIYVIQPKSLPS